MNASSDPSAAPPSPAAAAAGPSAPSAPDAPDALAAAFVAFAVEAGALRFGHFVTKAGRESPYFFNAGGFDDGARLARLASFYADRLDAGRPDPVPPFDVLYGPAYKGIPIAATVAVELARRGRAVPFAYNRKEAKDHGEGGSVVGAPLAGRRVLIVEDVISAGTSVRESLSMIDAHGGRAVGVMIALDRQERAREHGVDQPWSAVQDVNRRLGLHVASLATIDDLLAFLTGAGGGAATVGEHAARVAAYRERYGVSR